MLNLSESLTDEMRKNEALLEAAEEGDLAAIQQLLAEGAEVHAMKRREETPLHIAAIGDHAAAMQLLIAAGADVNAVTDYDDTPLHYAVCGTEPRACIELLIAEGSNVNFLMRNGPLHLAVRYGEIAFVELLLAAGADVNAFEKYDSKNTPLHWAARRGEIAFIELLVAEGANVNAVNDDWETPLALYDGYDDRVCSLLAQT